MTSQTEGKTAYTSYSYHPGTDLLAGKLTDQLAALPEGNL